MMGWQATSIFVYEEGSAMRCTMKECLWTVQGQP